MKLTRVASWCVSSVLLVLAGPLLAQAGAPVGAEFRVNTYTTSRQAGPAVATDSSGNFVVVWTSYTQDGSLWGIVGRRYGSSGAPAGAEFQVNTYTTDSQSYPSVASDASGRFVVVWSSYKQDGSAYGVFAQRYASSGAPAGAEFMVNTYTTNDQRAPSVASDSSGRFVVVWASRKQDGSAAGVFAQRYLSSGTPAGAEFQVNTYTTDNQNLPSVASDSSGNFVVVWQGDSQDGDAYGILGRRYLSSGAPAGAEFLVNTYTTHRQIRASVATDSSGNFVVVWDSYGQDGSQPGVFGQRFLSSGPRAGTEFQVNTFTTSYQSSPSVASDPSGNFAVVWSSYAQDGSYFGVFGRRYGSSGAPAGAEFLVNTFTSDLQSQASVASDPSGSFVVVWTSNTQDGSDYGVFGQRYGKIVPVELIRFTAE